MASLREKKCLPCQGGVPPLEYGECFKLRNQLNSRWHLNAGGDRLFCSLGIVGFSQNIPYLFREIGELSERENHHPELYCSRKRLDIQIWTHKINALVESDFILASKIDDILMKSNIPTTAFDQPHYIPPTEKYTEWHTLPKKRVLYRQFSFRNFRLPWEYALKILHPAEGFHREDLAVELGFGRLGIEIDQSQGKPLADKIDHLIKA